MVFSWYRSPAVECLSTDVIAERRHVTMFVQGQNVTTVIAICYSLAVPGTAAYKAVLIFLLVKPSVAITSK